jgi:hypothetical protein
MISNMRVSPLLQGQEFEANHDGIQREHPLRKDLSQNLNG